MKTAPLATLYFIFLLGMLPDAARAQPYLISADGLEVTDPAGLIWRRCAEGMTWNGATCSGTASTFTHEAALTQAQTVATNTAVAWRLPNVKELSSIVDKSAPVLGPAIDTAAFPATPNSLFWSATPVIDGSLSGATSAWTASFAFGGGGTFGNGRASVRYVRLVRAGQ